MEEALLSLLLVLDTQGLLPLLLLLLLSVRDTPLLPCMMLQLSLLLVRETDGIITGVAGRRRDDCCGWGEMIGTTPSVEGTPARTESLSARDTRGRRDGCGVIGGEGI